MVQFGNYLKAFRHKPWSKHYLKYDLLKKLIYELKVAVETAPEPVERESDLEQGRRLQEQLRTDIEDINSFFLRKKKELHHRFSTVLRNLEHWRELEGATPDDEDERARKIARLSKPPKEGETWHVVDDSDESSDSDEGDEEDELSCEEYDIDMYRGGASPETAHVRGSLEGYAWSEEWHRRRRALMLEIKHLFGETQFLRDFSSLNYTGFSMILKKHDKNVPQFRCKSKFIKEVVNPQDCFGFLDDLVHLAQQLIMVYSDEFLNGNRLDADIALTTFVARRSFKDEKIRRSFRAIRQPGQVYATTQSMSLFNEDQLWWVEQERHEPESNTADLKKEKVIWRNARTSLMAAQSLESPSKKQQQWTMVISLLLVLCGGLGQSMSLEKIVRGYSGAGPTISFFQYLFVAAEGFRNFAEWSDDSYFGLRLIKREVPFTNHVLFLLCSWLAAVLSAMALDFNVTVATSMIFKSMSLMSNMTLGYLILGKNYSRTQVFSVVLLTVGVLLYTYFSLPTTHNGEFGDDLSTYLIGLTLLLGGLLSTAFIGIVQDLTFRKHGKHWREMMFYAHFMGLFLFILLGDDIYEHIEVWTRQTPEVWIYMALNTLAQYMCIKGIYQFISLTSSLAGQLVLTVRKFLLVVVSVLVFDSAFTSYQWGSVGVVLAGALIYTFASQEAEPPPQKQSRRRSLSMRKTKAE